MLFKTFLFILVCLFSVSCGSSTKRPVAEDPDMYDENDIGVDEDHVPDTCGNGKIDEGEVCDGNLINCTDIDDRLYSGGRAWCRDDCLGYDTITCEEVFHECGNGIVEGPEECDGGVIDCVDIDPYLFSGGKAACKDDCSGWDTITCDEREPVCGDGIVELGEVCDSETRRCAEINPEYYLGMAECNETCDGWDESDCVKGVAECGNGIVEGLEVCDSSIDDCVDIDPSKYSGGKAYCLDDCSGWDTITCTERPATIDWTGGHLFVGGFEPRASHCAVYFKNRFWVIAGSGVDGTFSDVWSSSDGALWTKEVSSGPFGERQRHKCVVYDEKIWIIGGRDDSGTNIAKVWYSSDGIVWNEDSSVVEDFLPGSNFEALVRGGSLFVFSVAGGIFNPIAKGVWERNIHGWNRISETVPYDSISSFAGGVLDGTFYLTGGIDASFSSVNNTIWYSDDGIEWSSAQGDFLPRAFHSVVEINGVLFLLGGNTLMTRTNDVLRSNDGKQWGIITTDAGFSGRSSHAVAKSEVRLCVFGGTLSDGSYTNSVWCTGI